MKITQRILVTGAAGFLGSHLCERLLKEGYEVVGVDNFLTGQKRNISELDLFEKFSFVEGDICDGSTIFEKMGTGFSSIFHLASPASPVDYTEYPLETLWVNAAGTKNVLEFARLNSAQVIFASTSEVYGDPQVHPQREDYFGYVNSVGPRSCYDEGKRFAESLCWNFSQKNRVPIKIARIFNTYGPRMAVTDGRVVSEFFRSALDQVRHHMDLKTREARLAQVTCKAQTIFFTLDISSQLRPPLR
jgi:nucleoside-diphosphate-sugar epimerase